MKLIAWPCESKNIALAGVSRPIELHLPMTDGNAGQPGDLEGADHSTGVIGGDSMRRKRIDLTEPFTQGFDSVRFNICLHRVAKVPVRRRARIESTQDAL